MDDLYHHWAKTYDYFFGDRGAEIDFWAAVAEPYGRRLLDAMCGTAEVSLALARRGHRVAGLDLSPAMLAVAAQRLAAAADYPARGLSLLLGDVTHIPAVAGSFDFALVGGNGSFNHLDAGAAARALQELRRVLRPGGALGLELVNPHLLKEVYPERTFGPFRPTPPGVSVEKVSRNRYDATAGLFHIEQMTHFEIGGVQGEFEERFHLHVWPPERVQAMLHAAGFGGVRFYGDYQQGAFDTWSSDLLVVAGL
ncbi:MAG: class I SAM-dependent methyltransferase [Anaerolineae bacterium]